MLAAILKFAEQFSPWSYFIIRRIGGWFFNKWLEEYNKEQEQKNK